MLTRSRISDIAPLAALTRLQHLHLSFTAVSDVAPLAGMAELEGCFLTGSLVDDIAPLAGLVRLERLDLGDTRDQRRGSVGEAAQSAQPRSVRNAHQRCRAAWRADRAAISRPDQHAGHRPCAARGADEAPVAQSARHAGGSLGAGAPCPLSVITSLRGGRCCPGRAHGYRRPTDARSIPARPPDRR